jgi:hypothetical protein
MQKTSSSKALVLRETTIIRIDKTDIRSYLRAQGALPSAATNISVSGEGTGDDFQVTVVFTVETKRED